MPGSGRYSQSCRKTFVTVHPLYCHILRGEQRRSAAQVGLDSLGASW